MRKKVLILSLLASLSLKPAYGNGYQGYIVSLDSALQVLIQEKLLEQGFDPGVIDGKYGPNTRRALLAFREANNINEGEYNGLLTPMLARSLLGVEIEPGANGVELSDKEELALIEQLGLVPTKGEWGILPD